MDIDWDLLGSYFLPHEETVDFDYELYGRATYRRDAVDSTREDVSQTSTQRALDLLDGLSSIHKDGGHDWVEEDVRTCDRTNPRQTETTQTEPSRVHIHTTRPVRRVRVSGCTGRHTKRSVGMHVMWPDPATGCVYGGHCALLIRPDQERQPCVHPQIQPRGPLPRRDIPTHWKLKSIDRRRDQIPYASRARWEKHRRSCDR